MHASSSSLSHGQVVEMSSDGQQQARALQLLLQLQASSQEMAQEFRSMSGPLMVAKVLASERCHVGPQMLKVRNAPFNWIHDILMSYIEKLVFKFQVSFYY